MDAISIPVWSQFSPGGGIVRARLILGYALRMHPLISRATADDTARIGAIARAAYAKYVPRIGREPAPLVADFAGHMAAGHVVVIETAGAVDGYMVGWPETDAYFVDNITVDPARQGNGLGRKLMAHAAHEAKRRHLPAIRLYTNAAMTENLSMYAIWDLLRRIAPWRRDSIASICAGTFLPAMNDG